MDTEKPNTSQIESWITALKGRDGLARQRARWQLVALGRAATPFLIPLLSDHETQTRWEAAMALSEIADPASIPALLQTLADEEDDVGWLAAEALAAIGRPAVEPLLRALIAGAGSVDIRNGAHHALRRLRRTDIGDKIEDVYTALDIMHSDVEVIAAAQRSLQTLNSSE
jgi:HEAT repeat protein